MKIHFGPCDVGKITGKQQHWYGTGNVRRLLAN